MSHRSCRGVVIAAVLLQACGNSAEQRRAAKEVSAAFRSPQDPKRAAELEYYARDVLKWDVNTLMATNLTKSRIVVRSTPNMPQVVYETRNPSPSIARVWPRTALDSDSGQGPQP